MGTENLRRKIIRINHWCATPTSTLTSSSWIVTPNSIFHPYGLSDLFISWMSLQNKESGNGFPKQTCPTNLFSAVHHIFVNMDSWKAGRAKNLAETSLWQARVAREKGLQILGTENLRRKIIRINRWCATPTATLTMFELDCNSQLNISPLRTLWSLHQLNVFAKQREREWIPETNMSNKSFFGSALHCWEHGQLKGWPPQKPSRNFTVTGTSCKKQKDCKSWEQTFYGERPFESITDAQLLLRRWRCSSNALHFWEHRQLKGWPPHFEPIVAKNSILTSVHCFVAFVAWKHGADFCKMPQQMDHEPKKPIENSLWQAWVAWIKGGQQILGTGIHHLFTTQTSTLMMFVLDCDSQLNISPLPTLWSLHGLNVFAKQESGNGFLKQTCCRKRICWTCLFRESIPALFVLQRHSTDEEIRESVRVKYWVGSYNPARTSSASQ